MFKGKKPIFMFVSTQKLSGRIQKKLFPVAASGKGGWAIVGEGGKKSLTFHPTPFCTFLESMQYECIYHLFKIMSNLIVKSYNNNKKNPTPNRRNSLMVQWLGFHISTAEGAGSIPSQGTKILQVTRWDQKQNKTNSSKQFF